MSPNEPAPVSVKRIKKRNEDVTHVATSIEDTKNEYALVEQATLALLNHDIPNLTYPPIYGTDSSPFDTNLIAETDNDEWLEFPTEEWTLEHILQAEQVIASLIKVKSWAEMDENQTWTPGLSFVGRDIDPDELLPQALSEIKGSVEIIRVRSIVDPSGRSVSLISYSQLFTIVLMYRDLIVTLRTELFLSI